MIKLYRFSFVFGFAVLFALPLQSVKAFRDVAPNAKIYSAVQYLLEKEILEDGAFFRADSEVPAQWFWPIVLRDADFDPESASFDTPLPPNIEEDNELAPYLREALRRGFIFENKNFDPNLPITRIEAIKVLAQTKGLPIPSTLSDDFLEKVDGVAPSFRALPYVETALASNMLTESDINPLQPYKTLTRRDLVTWLYNYAQNGEKKSNLDQGTSTYTQRVRSLRDRAKKTTEEQTTPSEEKQTIRIQIMGNNTNISSSGSSVLPNGRVLEAIYSEILQEYRFDDQLTTAKKEEMIDAAIAAMVKTLGDKYSSYIEPAQSKEFRDGLDGKFEGIGAYVEMIDKQFTITAPIKGSPAEYAGIEAGDVVLKVNGEDILELSQNDIIAKIKGPAGTSVTLLIKRGNTEKELKVVRNKVTIPSVTIEWQDSIPIVGVHQFNNDTQEEFEKILTEHILPKSPRGMVLDLRNNPGGFLTSAVQMGEFFVGNGDLIFTVEEKNNERQYRSSKDGILRNMDNIIVLVNKGTASASEILAGMLQDYGKAKLLGTTTLGKGTVQEVLNYPNGGILRLTIAKWLTPKDRWIQDGEIHGLIPDIEIEDPTTEERQLKLDRQKEKAVVEVLRK